MYDVVKIKKANGEVISKAAYYTYYEATTAANAMRKIVRQNGDSKFIKVSVVFKDHVSAAK